MIDDSVPDVYCKVPNVIHGESIHVSRNIEDYRFLGGNFKFFLHVTRPPQGSPRLQSVGTLLISWLLVCACLIRGIRSSGRVVYFTSFFPYAVLSALAARGITMPGATEGIAFLFRPKWGLLANPQIWTDAATQGKYVVHLI